MVCEACLKYKDYLQKKIEELNKSLKGWKGTFNWSKLRGAKQKSFISGISFALSELEYFQRHFGKLVEDKS